MVMVILEDGSFRHVDCDLNIPTISVCTEYDGNIEEVGSYLLQTRPVGWIEEAWEQQEGHNSQHLVD